MTGMPQWVAKADHLMAPLHLEKLFLGRHKFHHFRIWYRDKLGNYLKEVLLDPRSRSRSPWHMEKMVKGHIGTNATPRVISADHQRYLQRSLAGKSPS